jgi:hypothetical protein
VSGSGSHAWPLILLVVVACGRGADECTVAVEHVWESADVAPSTRDVRAAIIASCRETGWSHEILDCMTNVDASNNESRRRCFAMLLPDQRAAMDNAARDAGLRAYANLRDRMCACTNTGCTWTLYKEEASLGVAMQTARLRDPATKQAMLEIAKELKRCFEQRQ